MYHVDKDGCYATRDKSGGNDNVNIFALAIALSATAIKTYSRVEIAKDLIEP